MLTVNSPVASISLYEYLWGRMPNPNMGGSEEATPAHAKVIMFGFPSGSTHVTRTTGQGKRAAQGFFFTFHINTIIFLYHKYSAFLCS